MNADERERRNLVMATNAVTRWARWKGLISKDRLNSKDDMRRVAAMVSDEVLLEARFLGPRGLQAFRAAYGHRAWATGVAMRPEDV